MQKIKTKIFKTIALMAFTGLVIAGYTGTSSANSGNGGQDYRDSDTMQGTGSGTGGSDTGTTNDTGSSYRNEDKGNSTDNSSGSGTGGSTDTDTYTSPSNYNQGTGPNYGTAPLGGPSGDGMGNPGPVKR